MINVCIFNGDMSRGGGTERITQILANGLVETNKYNVYVLNLNNDKKWSFYPLNPNIHFEILKKRSIYLKIIELFFFLITKKIDIIIDVDIMLGIYTLPAIYLNPKIKLISWEMFNLRNDIGSKHTNIIRKISLKKSNFYVNQSQGDMNAFLNEMPVKCPIIYIYNPCEIDYNYKDYNINSKTIITAGHFFYTKGYDLAIEVAKLVFSKHSDWIWEFYGDGKELEKSKAKVKEYKLEKNIIFKERTKNLEDAYKQSSLYVMTSRTEGFGLVLTEAKSFNLPTIAFDIDFGPREIIENNISGYLIKDFNIKEMADKINYLIENPNKRKEFSTNAKNNCYKFTEKEFINKWMNIIDGVSK